MKKHTKKVSPSYWRYIVLIVLRQFWMQATTLHPLCLMIELAFPKHTKTKDWRASVRSSLRDLCRAKLVVTRKIDGEQVWVAAVGTPVLVGTVDKNKGAQSVK